MNRQFFLGLILLICIALTSCATHQQNVAFNPAFTYETWMNQVASNTMGWTRGADRWFLTGDPNMAELRNRNAPYSTAMSTTSVRVPNFSNLKIDGDFQVQIFGTYNPNSVYLYGPNDALRQIKVQVVGNVLCLTQLRKMQPIMRHVIIRIGMNNLVALTHTGCSTVEGITLRSTGLTVNANGPGNIYLSGDLNLRQVTQLGRGSVNVFGANTPCLMVQAIGPGPINISGPHVGLKSIVHHGASNINIVGATSTGMTIAADGVGKIGMSGRDINLSSVTATDGVCVYAYNVNSPNLYVHAYKHAKVGLMGYAGNMYAEVTDNAIFWGRYLCAMNAYVRSSSCGHINVAAGSKIFASATQSSSIYFYGSPDLMSQFVSGGAVVIPIWSNTSRSCLVVYPIASGRRIHPRGGYKGEI